MSKFSDNPIIYLTRKTWEYSKDNKKNVVLYFVMFIFANAIGFVEPLLVAKIINTIQIDGVTEANIVQLGFLTGAFIVIGLAFWAFHGPARVIEQRNSYKVKANFKEFLIGGTMDLPVAWHTDHHSGDTIDKVEKGTGRLYDFAGDGFQIIESLLLLIGSYIALVYFNVYSSFIVIIMVILTGVIVMKFDHYLIPRYKKYWKYENEISAKIYDAISNISTVIILRIQKLITKDIMRKIWEPYDFYMKNVKIEELKWFLVSVLTSLMTFFVLFSYLFSVMKAGEVILIGSFAALYAYVNRINGLFFRFAYMYSSTVRRRTAVMNSEEVSKEFEEVERLKNINLNKNWKHINIEDLTFSYHTKTGAELHLEGVSIDIYKGQKIALVGESGSGKTTMLKVIRELYEPKNLHLELDGKLLEGGFSELSDNISLIPQDPEIFNTTIEKNITVGLKQNMKTITKYTDMAMFSAVAEKLPKKYESSIVEKGVNLSGGEKQRLALARGLLASSDKAIVLLDEPTSSVDTKNELAIYENIFKSFNDKTIISSIHRLHLLPLFDKVYLFEAGKVVGEGTFDELRSNSNKFKAMWDKYSGTQRIG